MLYMGMKSLKLLGGPLIDECSSIFNCGSIGGWTGTYGTPFTSTVSFITNKYFLSMNKSSSSFGGRYYEIPASKVKIGDQFTLSYTYTSNYRNKGLLVKNGANASNATQILARPNLSYDSNHRGYTSGVFTVVANDKIFICFEGKAGSTHSHIKITNVVLNRV